MWSIPLLAEEGWLRHQLKSRSHRRCRRRARSASAIARSRNSGQLGEIFRPEQFRRTDHPGRAVSERIHFYLWRVHPSSARRGIVRAIFAILRRNPQQFDQIPAKDRFLVRIAKERSIEDEIDADRPIERIVRPIDHMSDTDFGDQMPQAFLVKDHRINIELLPEIFARFLLERLA